MSHNPIKDANSADLDDQKTYEELSQFLENTTDRLKNKDASVIQEMGDSFLAEIEQKKNAKRIEAGPRIKYILRKTKKYTREYLQDLDYRDVKDIYDELKHVNRGLFNKLCDMFINS